MSDITANQAPEATLEQSLNKTDMGHWLYQHRKSFLSAVVVVLVGTIGYVAWKQQHQSHLSALSEKVHQFETSAVADLKAKKINPEEFVTKFGALENEVQTTPAMVPVAIDAANALKEIGDSVKAESILAPMMKEKGLSPKDPAYMFVVQNYAALAETNGKPDEAIRVLEAYVTSGNKVFLTKTYLDLGRLYLVQNNKEKAKTNLEYIVSNYPNDELAKLARLYLQQINLTP